MKRTIIAALILTLCLTLAFSSSAFSEKRQRYPIMRPGAETLARWVEDYQKAPKAPAAPKRMVGVVREGDGTYGGALSLLNNIQYTPSQRNQGQCGNCWAWAGTGVLELALYAQRSVKDRLSVQLLDACYRNDPYPGGDAFCACEGGNLAMFANFYNGKGYAVPWSNPGAAYADAGGTCTTTCGDITTTPNYAFSGAVTAQSITTISVSQDDAIANIKNILNQNRGVWFAYYLADDPGWSDFFDYWADDGESVLWNPDSYCGVSVGASEYGGHAVLVVGYDDNDPDPANHYWVVLNSWGATVKRPNGLYRMKMRMNYGCTMTVTGLGTIPARLFQTLNVTFPICSYALSESGKSFPSVGSSGSVDVTAGETCNWTAASNASWITITAGASGTGNGTVSYSIQENTGGTNRVGAITVADQVYTVTQSGVSPPDTTAVPAGGGGGGGCFIATAAFGSPLEPHVQVLRDFRDEYLSGHAPGRLLMRLYDDLSPSVARFISGHEGLKTAVRLSLLPLIGFAFVALQVGAELMTAVGFFCAAFILVGIARCRRMPGPA